MVYTRNNIPDDLEFKFYKKKKVTKMARIIGSFQVETRGGIVKCNNGYLAIDSHGYPYPIHRDEVEEVYECIG